MRPVSSVSSRDEDNPATRSREEVRPLLAADGEEQVGYDHGRRGASDITEGFVSQENDEQAERLHGRRGGRPGEDWPSHRWAEANRDIHGWGILRSTTFWRLTGIIGFGKLKVISARRRVLKYVSGCAGARL